MDLHIWQHALIYDLLILYVFKWEAKSDIRSLLLKFSTMSLLFFVKKKKSFLKVSSKFLSPVKQLFTKLRKSRRFWNSFTSDENIVSTDFVTFRYPFSSPKRYNFIGHDWRIVDDDRRAWSINWKLSTIKIFSDIQYPYIYYYI